MVLLVDIVVVIALTCIVALLIRRVFYRLDNAIREEVRCACWNRLRGVPTSIGILSQTHALLRELMGDKYVSRKSCVVSCAMSLLLFISVAVVFRKTWTGKSYTDDVSIFFVAMPIFGICVNAIPDYLVILKSRRIFQVAAELPSRRQKFELIGCDLLAGLTLKVLMVFTIELMVNVMDGNSIRQAGESVVQLAINVQSGGKPAMALVLFTLTAASAEIWLGLYVLSSRLLYQIQRASSLSGRLWRLTSEERMREHPLRCVGDTASMLVALALLIVGGLASIFPAN